MGSCAKLSPEAMKIRTIDARIVIDLDCEFLGRVNTGDQRKTRHKISAYNEAAKLNANAVVFIPDHPTAASGALEAYRCEKFN